MKKQIFKTPRYVFLFFIVVKLTFAQPTNLSSCVTIDFESLPADSIIDGMIINNQFLDSLGITFILEDSTFPHIAQIGNPKTAFESAWGNDTPAPDQNTGTFFLTDDGLTSGITVSPLWIHFTIPVDSASGVVLDIDGSESFNIEAYNDSGIIIDTFTVSYGDIGTGDGLATPWSVKSANEDIYSIRFVGKRTQAGFFGLGFDNFTSCSSLRITTIFKTELSLRSYFLFDNYPNPFNPKTKIEFYLKKAGFVNLSVYNQLGQKISTIVNENRPPGKYLMEFDAGALTSGIYYYIIKVDNFITAKKMILIK